LPGKPRPPDVETGKTRLLQKNPYLKCLEVRMSTDGSSSPARRMQPAEAVEAGEKDQDDRQAAYYAMLAARLESLLEEIDSSGSPQDDELVTRLRALHTEVQRQVERNG
jgi:hypothetical protein